MNELIKVNYDSDRPTILGRDLYEFLEVGTEFRHWFPRMCEYGFAEDIDYTPVIFDHPQNGQPTKDYQLTIEMAKEICMLQRNEKGKQARQYFIELERKWNLPEFVMARAVKMADRKIKELETKNSEMKVQIAIMAPKSDYFDDLVDRNLLTSFRDTAKELGIKERDFIDFLILKKYVYRDQKGKIMPYADKNNGLFEVKECFNKKTDWAGVQTLITPKGRETFRLLYQGNVTNRDKIRLLSDAMR